jgi:sugar phosphate isomerase/epimerase
MPHLTLGWLTLMNASPEEVLSAAAAAEFKSVSIRVTGRRIGEPYAPITSDRKTLREVRQRLDDSGLRLSNTSAYHLSPEVTLDDLRPAVEATVELGARVMVATCADPDHGRWVDFMSRYCDVAHAAGITLALEAVPFSQAKTIDVAYDLVRRTGAPNFGLLIDALHLSRSGGKPADIAKVDPQRIVFVQLCDAVADSPPHEGLAHEARTGRLYPGEGVLPLYEFLDALPAGIEIECEAPRSDYAGLSHAEQARRAGVATQAFLNTYARSRGKQLWR